MNIFFVIKNPCYSSASYGKMPLRRFNRQEDSVQGVTVIVTTFNGATRGFLRDAIESVLRQSFSPIELLIVDDGSTDKTAEICKSYLAEHSSDRTIRYLYKENGGPASARNLGISEASHSLITFLDDDDFYEPTMVEKMVEALEKEKNRGADFAYCRTRHIDRRGRVEKSPFYSGKLPLYEALFFGNVLSTPAVMIHKGLFSKHGTFKEHLKYAEDYDLWLRLAREVKSVACDEILVNIRLHDRQLSKSPHRMELYHAVVLFEAIERGGEKVKADAYSYRYHFYLSYMRIYLGLGYYSDFRRLYNSAKGMGALSLSWKIKYWLSFFPMLFTALQSQFGKSETA